MALEETPLAGRGTSLIDPQPDVRCARRVGPLSEKQTAVPADRTRRGEERPCPLLTRDGEETQ